MDTVGSIQEYRVKRDMETLGINSGTLEILSTSPQSDSHQGLDTGKARICELEDPPKETSKAEKEKGEREG